MFDHEAAEALLELVGAVESATLTEADLVDHLESMERLTSAAAAGKARVSAELHARRVAHEEVAGVPAARRGRAVANEIALARHESPHHGREHLSLALALVHDLPETLSALARGDISEHRAQLITRETADLVRADRACVDATLGPLLAGMGDREVTVAVRRLVGELDAEGLEARCRRARARRRVTCRTLSDGMARVTAELPAEDALVAVQSLREHADLRRALGDDRSRDQVMADELVARLDRPAVSGSRGVEVQLVMSAEMLLGADVTSPPHLVGYGPVPHGVASRLLADAEGEVLVRRLFANPDDNSLVAMDSRGIVFTGGLRRMLFARDGETCRTPWCDAPVRHADHVNPRARGGRTTLDGGQGLCESCNYAKESPGWRHLVRSRWPQRHATDITTPTGHLHRSQAPPLPVRPSSPCQCRTITVELYRSAVELAC